MYRWAVSSCCSVSRPCRASSPVEPTTTTWSKPAWISAAVKPLREILSHACLDGLVEVGHPTDSGRRRRLGGLEPEVAGVGSTPAWSVVPLRFTRAESTRVPPW